MTRDDVITGLRSVEHALLPELTRAGRQDLAPPPRQPVETYAPPQYRQDEIDPVIKGLLTHLPVAGSVWPAEARKLWLELLDGSFRMIYKEIAAIEAPPTPTPKPSVPLADSGIPA